jgi:hypothetical protein
MNAERWSSAFRAVVWLILAVAALIWSFASWAGSTAWTITVVVVKTCTGVATATWYVLRGGI